MSADTTSDTTTEKLAGFKSPEAERRWLGSYDALRDEFLPADRVERTIETDAGPTFVTTVPGHDGIPIVLLPGHGGPTVMWQEHVRALAGGPTLHLVDLVGEIGRSVQRAPLREPGHFAHWLDQVLDGLGVERAHLAGVSLGGWLALNQAVRSPGRVAAVTVSEPPGIVRLNLPRFIVCSLGGLGAAFLPDLLGRPLAALLRSGIRRQPKALLRLLAQGLRHFRFNEINPPLFTDDELRSITQPTFVELGDHSECFKATRLRARAEALIPGVDVVITAASCHSVSIDHPDQIVARLLAPITPDGATTR